MPFVCICAGGLLILGFGQAEEQQAAEAERGALRPRLTASSMERLKTPGMEPTSRRTPSPGQRKRG